MSLVATVFLSATALARDPQVASSAVGPDAATAGLLDRVMPQNSKATQYAFRSISNGQFLKVSSDGQLSASGTTLTTQHLFEVRRLGGIVFALISVGNGQFVSAENAGNGPLAANRNALSLWETFRAIDNGDNLITIRAEVNGKNVTAEDQGRGPLIANRDNIGAWEQFRMMPVIDMAQVISAFADRHPNQRKLRTYNSVVGSGGYFSNQAVFDRRVPGKNEVIVTSQSYDGVLIHDWYWLANDRVGIHGTFPIYENASWLIWDQMILSSYRYMTPDMTGVKLNTGTYSSYTGANVNSPMLSDDHSPTQNHNIVAGIMAMSTGGSIGSRWYIGIKTDPGMPGILEEWRYDLGPTPGVYDPEFGAIGYIQTNRPNDNGSGAEYYGTLDAYDGHSSFFNYWNY